MTRRFLVGEKGVIVYLYLGLTMQEELQFSAPGSVAFGIPEQMTRGLTTKLISCPVIHHQEIFAADRTAPISVQL